jgi:D-glucosaminate-6-phosphate ammonia-lyase
MSKQSISRRQAFLKTAQTAGWAAALGLTPAQAATKGPGVYTRIGGKPFINLTATYTINGGALMRPEVKQAMEEASNWPVNLDELMEKVGARLSHLLGSESAMVTAGAAAALAHATAGVITGGDPEKMQQLPDLTGLKSEVLVPKASRNTYDHAIRSVGIKMVEIETEQDLRRALGPRTAMIAVLGTGEARSKLRLEQLADAGRKHRVPILVDAAAELPYNPNPYLKRGADLVAYSGGKFLRGPQCAGLLIGRKDLIQAAWLNSSPHHAFGRSMKVGKEEIMGMLAAIEVWRNNYDLEGEYKMWESWYGDISEKVQPLGVKTEIIPAAGASPFPTMNLEWNPQQIGLTAGEIGEMLLNGEPRIMSHAEGEGFAFRIRGVAMKPGESKIVARRLEEIFRKAPKGRPEAQPASPVADLTGSWTVEIKFVAGATQHRLDLRASGNQLSGSHLGRLAQAEINGRIDGDQISFRSSLPYEGTRLSYDFSGKATGTSMTGEVSLGEYGKASWSARRSG